MVLIGETKSFSRPSRNLTFQEMVPLSSSRRVRTLPLPPSANVSAAYPAAVVAATADTAAAQSFVRFLRGPAGHALLLRYGFQ